MDTVGVDAGNSKVKVFGKRGAVDILGAIGDFRERNLKSNFSPDDIEFEFHTQKGFSGPLAYFESTFYEQLGGTTKAHEDLILRVLFGLWKYYDYSSPEEPIRVVIGQPIIKYSEKEKEKMINLVRGSHFITINGIGLTFNIVEVFVSPEGAGAFWCNPTAGKIRIIDAGSQTINIATILDGRYLDSESYTLSRGFIELGLTEENRKVLTNLVRSFKKKGVDITDTIRVCGGAAELVVEWLKAYYFINLGYIQPSFNNEPIHPVYANAVGFYKIGVNLSEHR